MCLSWRGVAQLENGRAFVHFGEHGHVGHVEAQVCGGVELFPEELAT